MAVYPKFVKVNRDDICLAVRAGVHPMLEWVDPKHDGLPYFENYIDENRYGNYHHFTFSASHMTGRRLEALTMAQKVFGIEIPEETYDNLEKWAYRVFDNPMKMMCNWDLERFEPELICDLHNLREVMYSFVGLIRRNPEDKRAREMAHHLIRMVDRYTDYETGDWKEAEFHRDTGGTSICSVCTPEEKYRFTAGPGRYIESLVRLCQETYFPEALEQAIRLGRTFFSVVLDETGSFDVTRFCAHIHSVTATICGIAMLGDYLQNREILDRVDRFMKNGFYGLALDLGWSTENDARKDWVGEINNSCDLMEACLYLAKNGYPGYYGRAEGMLRNHILPSQLLDVSFLPDEALADDSVSHMGSRMRGAFGFPCPYGHEDEPGSTISFNWDINAGGVSGLCQAWGHRAMTRENMVRLNLLFDYEDDTICFHDPYKNNGVIRFTLKKKAVVCIRIPMRSNIRLDSLKNGGRIERSGEWLVLTDLPTGEETEIFLELLREEQTLCFKGKELEAVFCGEYLEAISSSDKRLCFFPVPGECL